MNKEIQSALDVAIAICEKNNIVPTAFLYESSTYLIGMQGRTLMHARKDLFGQFADGHRIRTSIVTHYEIVESLLIAQTLSFSRYVVIGYAPETSMVEVITELRDMLGYDADDMAGIIH